MFKLIIFFFSGKLCMVVCIILSTVYIIVYQEKYCHIYILFILISFLILPYCAVLAGNNLFHL